MQKIIRSKSEKATIAVTKDGKTVEYTLGAGLKEQYPYIRKIAYHCKYETACLVGAGTSLSKIIKDLIGKNELVLEYEKIKKSGRVDSAGRASYVERNQWTIMLQELKMKPNNTALFLGNRMAGIDGTKALAANGSAFIKKQVYSNIASVEYKI